MSALDTAIREGVAWSLFPARINSPRELTVAPIHSRTTVREFLNVHHYLSGYGVPAYRVAFGVWHGVNLVGVGVFGVPRARHEDYISTVELYRFCLLDVCPRNSESYTLARMLKQLREMGFGRVISYSDPSHGHTGTIYKAVGFVCLGERRSSPWSHRAGRRATQVTRKIKWEKWL